MRGNIKFGTTTTVTLNTLDTDGQTWNNGSWTAQLYSPPGVPGSNYVITGTGVTVPNQQQSGTFNGSGVATFIVTPNTSISPSGTKWQVTICPQATPAGCTTVAASVTGATQTFNPSLPGIRVSVQSPTIRATAYQNLEITGASIGSTYYNLTSATINVCNTVVGTNCTAWSSLSVGGGIPNTSAVQGEGQIGASGGTSTTPSPSALHAEAFCAGGFNAVTGACSGGNYNTMCLAIASAGAAAWNTSGDIDARAFSGQQVWAATCSVLSLYGGATTGSTVKGRLFLGNSVQIALDGPAGGFYSDGSGSYVGTPAIIIPNNFLLMTSNGTIFAPCVAVNNPLTGCTTAFPQRALPITNIVVTCTQGCQGVYTTSTALITSGGPPSNQNIYPTRLSGAPGLGGEFAYIAATGTTAYNVARTIQSATGTTFTIDLPAGTSTAGCSGSCGTAYLGTPMIATGAGNPGDPYAPQQAGYTAHSQSIQSFKNGYEGGGQIWCGTSSAAYFGCEAYSNVNGGEMSHINGMQIFYLGNAGGIIIRSGSNDSGPYENIYITNVGNNVATKATVPIASENSNRGISNWTVIMGNTSNPPDAAVMVDGVVAGTPYSWHIGPGHSEWPTDYIELGCNAPVQGGFIDGQWMQNSSHGSVNGIHICKDGLTANAVKGMTMINITAQSGALSGATLLDDINGISCTDLLIANYTLDINGAPAINTCGGGLTTNNLVVTSVASSTSPICPNGTNGAFTTSGCSGASSAWSSITNGSGPLNITPGGISAFNTTTALADFSLGEIQLRPLWVQVRPAHLYRY